MTSQMNIHTIKWLPVWLNIWQDRHSNVINRTGLLTWSTLVLPLVRWQQCVLDLWDVKTITENCCWSALYWAHSYGSSVEFEYKKCFACLPPASEGYANEVWLFAFYLVIIWQIMACIKGKRLQAEQSKGHFSVPLQVVFGFFCLFVFYIR